MCTKTEKLLSAEADLFQDNAAYPVHFDISSCRRARRGAMGGKVGEGRKKKKKKAEMDQLLADLLFYHV